MDLPYQIKKHLTQYRYSQFKSADNVQTMQRAQIIQSDKLGSLHCYITLFRMIIKNNR